MRTTILLLLVIIFTHHIVFGSDTGLELIHADKSVGKMMHSEKVRQFEGNVHFRQDTLNMYCERAIFFTEKDRTDFEGSVRINDGHRNIQADKIEYYSESRLAICVGNVVLTDVNDSLTTGNFSYNFTTKKAIAENDLYIKNKQNGSQIWGQYGFYNPEQKYMEVNTNAKLVYVDSTGNDTLTIYGNKLEYSRLDPPMAKATGSVKIYQGKLKAFCDTAIYFPDQEIALLKQEPVSWFEENEMSGTQIQVTFDSLKLSSIHITGKARAVNVVDSLKNKINILKGKEIHFDIKNKQPQKTIAIDNASSVYYLEEEGDDNGMNFATADTIKVFFVDGKADSINIIGGSEGVYYPEDYKGVKTVAE